MFTGMRRGELLGLRWSNVNFSKINLMVQKSLCYHSQGMELLKTKTERSDRTLALTRETIEILKKVKKEQTKNRLRLGETYDTSSNLVFCNADGSPITKDAFRHRYDKTKKILGINIRFQDLRHTHITQLIEAGVNLKIASSRAGHSTQFQTKQKVALHKKCHFASHINGANRGSRTPTLIRR